MKAGGTRNASIDLCVRELQQCLYFVWHPYRKRRMSYRLLLASAPAMTALIIFADCAAQQIDGTHQSLGDPTFQSASSEDQCRTPKREHSYLEPCISFSGQGPQIPIRDVPSSVHIINRDLLDDQKALSIEDALRNVNGVH